MDLFELAATLTLDTSGYEKGLSDAETKTSKFGEAIKGGLATAAKLGAAAIGAAATGISVLVKNSVEAYAEYEQLVGGVETLFKGSADKVVEYANNAYKTAGLSANEYMETVTGFSASLLQALGGDTAKAADMADQAIIDMSDNANKMGSDLASVQKAYGGFARGQFTMLDNLKLGYGGTKSEMERLLADAEKLSGVKYDISNFADITSAIHVIQTEMGITGTTAKEASETISGSLASMKSAWQNLVTGIADENANFDQLIGNFVDSAITAGDNIIPRIEQALVGVGKLVDGLAPVIADKLPELISKILPPLLSAATTLVRALVQSLPTIIKSLLEALPGVIEMLIDTVADMAPELAEMGVMIVIALIEGLTVAIPKLIEKLPEIVGSIATTLIENAPKILDAGISLIGALAQGLIDGIGAAISAAGDIVGAISDTFGGAISSAIEWGSNLVSNFASGFSDAWESVKSVVSNLADGVKNTFHNVMDAVKGTVSEKLENVKTAFEENGGGIKGIVAAGWEAIKGYYTAGFDILDKLTGGKLTEIKDLFVNTFTNLKDSAINWGKDLISNFVDGIKSMWDKAKGAVSSFAGMIKDFLGFSEPEQGPLSDFHTYAPDMMKLFAEGIKNSESVVTDQIKRSFNFSPTIKADVATNTASAAHEYTVPRNGNGGESRDVTVVLQLEQSTLARAVFKLYNDENSRVGVRVGDGGVY